METKVKTFIEEQKGTLVAQPDEWIEKVQELGLKGQERFLPGNEEAQETSKSVIPFPRMTREMQFVYSTAFPDKVCVDDYKEDPIPLGALAMLGLAQKEKYFCEGEDQIQVWHQFGHPDPILVGRKQVAKYEYHYYLMAQWGPEIIPFEDLKNKVTDMVKTKILASAKDVAAFFGNLANTPERLQLMVDEIVQGGGAHKLIYLDGRRFGE